MKAKLKSFLEKHYQTMTEKLAGASGEELQAMKESMEAVKPGLSEAFAKGEDAINGCLGDVEDEDAVIQVLWSKVLLRQEPVAESQEAEN